VSVSQLDVAAGKLKAAEAGSSCSWLQVLLPRGLCGWQLLPAATTVAGSGWLGAQGAPSLVAGLPC